MAWTAKIAGEGRLGREPREHQTRKGGAMASASVALDVELRNGDEPKHTMWLNCVAFGGLAGVLAGMAKGQRVKFMGALQADGYGEELRWGVVLDKLALADDDGDAPRRQAREAPAPRQAPRAAAPPPPDDYDYEDDIPF